MSCLLYTAFIPNTFMFSLSVVLDAIDGIISPKKSLQSMSCVEVTRTLSPTLLHFLPPFLQIIIFLRQQGAAPVGTSIQRSHSVLKSNHLHRKPEPQGFNNTNWSFARDSWNFYPHLSCRKIFRAPLVISALHCRPLTSAVTKRTPLHLAICQSVAI